MANQEPENEIQQHDVTRNAPAVGFFEQFNIIPNQPPGTIPEVRIQVTGATSHQVHLLHTLPPGPTLVIPVQQSNANITHAMFHVHYGGANFHGTWDQTQNPNYYACRVEVEVHPNGTVVGHVTLRSTNAGNTTLLDVQMT